MTSHLIGKGLTLKSSLFHQEKDSFLRDQAAALSKAVNQNESPVKEKHVRFIIIGTFEEKGGLTFWSLISKSHLQDHPIVAWKFCHVLHKVLRDGHKKFIQDSQKYKGLLLELGKLWGHLKEGYGKSIQCYCNLLERKLDFHMKNPSFPGTLNVSDEDLIKIAENDVNNYFEISAEMFDYMDEILNLQASIFDSLDSSKANSMTVAGQCKISPLIPCIMDSSHLYDYIVKILFKLHASIPPVHLVGHRDRFLKEFPSLRKFYQSSHNLQYFKNLINVPSLPEHPPNFLIATELHQHVTPVVTLPEEVEDDLISEGTLIDTSDDAELNNSHTNGTSQALLEKDRLIEQMRLQIESLRMELERLRGENQDMKDAMILERNEFEQRLFQQQGDLEKMEEEKERLQQDLFLKTNLAESAEEVEKKVKCVEDKFTKLKDVYQKLRTEHIQLLRSKADVSRNMQAVEQKLKEMTTSCNELQTRVDVLEDERHKENESVAREAVESQAAINNLKEQLLQITEERNSLQQQLDTSKNQNTEVIEELQAQLAMLEANHQDNQQRCEKLNTEWNTLQTELEKERIRNEELEVERESLRTESSGFESRIEELEKSHTKLETQKDDLKSLLKQLLDAVLGDGLALIGDCVQRDVLNPSPNSPEYLLAICERVQKSLASLGPCYTQYIEGDMGKLGDVLCRLSGSSHLLSQLVTQGKAVAITVPDIDSGDVLSERCEETAKASVSMLEAMSSNPTRPLELNDLEDKLKLVAQQTTAILGQMKTEAKDNLASSLEEELADMERAIEAAVAQMEGMIKSSRESDTGIKLEVNGMILESCTALISAIKVLVRRSRLLQEEIVLQGKGISTAKDFYKRNHRWTEGLISAAKTVGFGAQYLVDSADKVLSGGGKFEELMVSSQEIAGGTAQLVVASRVKADRSSVNLAELTKASKGVSEATANVLATARNCMKLIEEKSDEVDLSSVSLHQAKKLEMESQVKVLELESALVKERARLASLRRAHYQMAGESEGWTKDDYQGK